MELIVRQFDFSSPDKTFVYLSGAQCSPDSWGIKDKPILTALSERRCPAFLKWEDARFLIEYKFGIHQTTAITKANVINTYIEGYLWVDGVTNWRKELKRILHDYVMQPTDRVVVIRKPYKAKREPYVPLLFRRVNTIAEDDVKIEFTSEMTDDEKLQLLMEAQAERMENSERTRTAFVELHPSDIDGAGTTHHKRQKPPADYVCHRCNVPGHFIQHCPTLSDPDFVPEYERRCPSGIPKKFLREATTEEERKRAWITAEGKYVILTYNPNMI